jgi:hypothetical protein
VDNNESVLRSRMDEVVPQQKIPPALEATCLSPETATEAQSSGKSTAYTITE